ncbi:MAG: 50S ribosomal protein L30 [candidate division WOR-3 bacterium]
MKKLKVTLIKSTIDQKPVHKKNVRALGLTKLNSFRIHNDTPQIRGMIEKVKHLVKVENAD